ncbi:hypothetical protein ABMY35_18010 [Pseudoalteromonas sp. BZB3]
MKNKTLTHSLLSIAVASSLYSVPMTASAEEQAKDELEVITVTSRKK